MKKKDITFIIGLSIFMGVLWVVGEVVMGIWLAVQPKTHIMWFAAIFVITLGISIWHSMIDDSSGLEEPKQLKYERKVNKRKK